MNKLDHLETLARRLIEGAFDRLFQTRLHPADLAHHLAVAIERGQQNGPQTQSDSIPNRYQILLNPSDYAALVGPSGHSAEVVASIRNYLLELIREGGYQLAGPLGILLDKHNTVLPGQVEIKTDYV